MAQFKAALAAAHVRSRLTWAALAERLGVSISTVKNWEGGTRHPQRRHHDQISAFLAEFSPRESLSNAELLEQVKAKSRDASEASQIAAQHQAELAELIAHLDRSAR